MIVQLMPFIALALAVPTIGWLVQAYRIGTHLRVHHLDLYKRLGRPNVLMLSLNPITLFRYLVFVLGCRDQHINDLALQRHCKLARWAFYAHLTVLAVAFCVMELWVRGWLLSSSAS